MNLETTVVSSPRNSQGFSGAAQFVEDQIKDGRAHLQESHVLGMHGKGALNHLFDVYADCRESDWDGYGAEPVLEITCRNARRFIDALPWGTPLPSFGAEPDGHLTLEWHHSPRRTLSVSVSPEGDLHYAALFGTEKVYGTVSLHGETLKTIVDLISRIPPVQ